MTIRVQPYRPEWAEPWDAFVSGSRNGTFHVTRRFLGYHRDRFDDVSLVVTDQNDRWLAVVPAAKIGEDFISHPGLTYAGVIVSAAVGLVESLEIFAAILDHLVQQRFRSLLYKTIPTIYQQMPAQDDLYALFLANATVEARHVWPTLVPAEKPAFQQRRNRQIAKARKAGITARRVDDFQLVWKILETLLARYGVAPVHSRDEISQLAALFPDNVKAFGASSGTAMTAAVVIFETENVARAQYIAASDEGKEQGALDLLFAYLIEEVYATKPFFEFGGVTEENGRALRRGLTEQKEGFGAHAIVQDIYRLPLTDGLGDVLRGSLR